MEESRMATEQEQMELFKDWDAPSSDSISVEELDLLSKQYADARADYETKKAISNEAFHHQENLKGKLIELFRKANKKKYSVEGVGNLTVVEKLKVKSPKEIADKKKLFDWFTSEFGEEGMLTFTGVNHNTLNRLYNEKNEEFAERGEQFDMPGVTEPELETTLQLRRS